MMISTFYDCHLQKSKENKPSKKDKPSSFEELTTSFSLFKSHKLLFKTNENRFECIDSIRFLATVLVFLAHYYVYFMHNPAGKGFLDEDGVNRGYYGGDWGYLIIRNRHIIDIHFAIRFVVGSLKKVYPNFLLILFQRFTFNL